MVGMAKDIADAILELYKQGGIPDVPVWMWRPHGQMEQGMKIQGHS
jgi:hypothetical protein